MAVELAIAIEVDVVRLVATTLFRHFQLQLVAYILSHFGICELELVDIPVYRHYLLVLSNRYFEEILLIL